MNYFVQKIIFVVRFKYKAKIFGAIRKAWYSSAGMKIGTKTYLPNIFVSWPHQVSIGNKCVLEHNVYFKYDGIWNKGPSIIIGNNVFIGSGSEFNISLGITIGDNCLIATGCRFIDHDHGTQRGILMNLQTGSEIPIKLGNDVWLGCNVIILKGVEIGDGAVVAAGAVVTKSILSNEIWAGVPAKKLGNRK